MHGFLVMWMAAGFCMLEVGLVRSRMPPCSVQEHHSLLPGSLWLVGYNLMYMDVSGFIGSFRGRLLTRSSLQMASQVIVLVLPRLTGSSRWSSWRRPLLSFPAVAERVKVFPFLIFTVFLTGLIYPIQGSWTWGGGWLQMGFSDFAGSTIVHSVGGWAALAGAIIIGAREDEFGGDGSVHPMPGSICAGNWARSSYG